MKRPTNGTIGFGVLLLGIVILIIAVLPPRSQSPTTVPASTTPVREPNLAVGLPPVHPPQSPTPHAAVPNRFDELRKVWKASPDSTPRLPQPTPAPATTVATGAQGRDPFEAVTPTRENIGAMVGRHFWWENELFLLDLRACPRLTACWSEGHIDYVDKTGFSVIGVANNAIGSLVEVDAHVRLDDGRTGYIALDGHFLPWYTQSPQARAQWGAEQMARAVAACQRRPSVAIGMTQDEVSASKWGQLRVGRVNTTETAGHTREQWVYDAGPECNEDGTPGVGAGRRGYLYFDNGLLVAIQK